MSTTALAAVALLCNLCDADPCFANRNRGSIGSWSNSNVLIGFCITASDLVSYNSFKRYQTMLM